MNNRFRSKRRALLGLGLAAAGGAICARAAAQQSKLPDGCTVVDGKISPAGWCMLYAAKVK